MNSAIFFNHITSNDVNKEIIKAFEDFSKKHDDIIIYLIQSPLSEDIHYDHEDKAIVVLSPGYKIIFLNLGDTADFENYYDDFISDLDTISSRYKYQNYIGRTRLWKDDLTAKYNINNPLAELSQRILDSSNGLVVFVVNVL